MLSVIVIGRNQRDALVRCCRSILAAIDHAKIDSWEILYVDSKSTDGSIEMLRETFGERVRIIELTGAISASIGRNAGARCARGDALFFIDGDCEADIAFLSLVYVDEQGLRFPVVSGGLREILYDKNGTICGEIDDRYGVTAQREDIDLGGIFCIKAQLFRDVGGFDNRYRSSEEMDLMSRIIGKGFRVTRLPHIIATHHTVDYFHLPRVIDRFRKGIHRYDGLLYREHLDNKYIRGVMIKQQRFTVILAITLIVAIFVHPLFLAIYPAAIFTKYRRHPQPGYLSHFLQTILRDIVIFFGFFAFFPKADSKSHEQIKSVPRNHNG